MDIYRVTVTHFSHKRNSDWSALFLCVQDFATRSLNISEESLAALNTQDEDNNDIQQYEMRRTWESRSAIICYMI
jgi:hypothetical protein